MGRGFLLETASATSSFGVEIQWPLMAHRGHRGVAKRTSAIAEKNEGSRYPSAFSSASTTTSKASMVEPCRAL